MIEQYTQLAPHDPVTVGHPLTSDLLITASLAAWMQQFYAETVDQAYHGRFCHETWQPNSVAVASVQWSAWVYALLLLAGYRTFGLTRAPDVPTRWWHGSNRWSLNTLWRAYRAAFWQQHEFHPLCSPTPPDWGEKDVLLLATRPWIPSL